MAFITVIGKEHKILVNFDKILFIRVWYKELSKTYEVQGITNYLFTMTESQFREFEKQLGIEIPVNKG